MIYQIFSSPKQKGETNFDPSTSTYFVTMSGRSFSKGHDTATVVVLKNDQVSYYSEHVD